ncbi:cytochrome c oxidase subunit IVB [Thalassobacillus pellis]|uniref:cytochrome c oxidase subunit IVB n=1 Tax=Thalassobacillus pellis TaxID=748008 RepID=UPI0019611472|nr:cytochrome c oxidase subunit IVB [Thalassobacillus pellis]MBM7552889.1 cytochrome c oxidase subunit 4 [Thalassobacillus pellis]
MAKDTKTKSTTDFKKEAHKEEMKQQVVTFALMIIFTIAAFALVVSDVIDRYFIIPIILLLALVQVIFQLYYFMHMKNKGHEMPALMIYGGISVAVMTILTFTTIIWW